jgi:N-acetylglutamate synthase-like GNAT family acetyltransferase
MIDSSFTTNKDVKMFSKRANETEKKGFIEYSIYTEDKAKRRHLIKSGFSEEQIDFICAKKRPVCMLKNIEIKEEFRLNKLGFDLIDNMLYEARRHSYSTVLTIKDRENKKGLIKFFEKSGFEPIKNRYPDFPDPKYVFIKKAA